jgi:hypothetical protein
MSILLRRWEFIAGLGGAREQRARKGADLPVMRATKFDFVINLQTVRTLGIAIPPTLVSAVLSGLVRSRRRTSTFGNLGGHPESGRCRSPGCLRLPLAATLEHVVFTELG